MCVVSLLALFFVVLCVYIKEGENSSSVCTSMFYVHLVRWGGLNLKKCRACCCLLSRVHSFVCLSHVSLSEVAWKMCSRFCFCWCNSSITSNATCQMFALSMPMSSSSTSISSPCKLSVEGEFVGSKLTMCSCNLSINKISALSINSFFL